MSEENITMDLNKETEIKKLTVNINLLINIKTLLEISASRGGFKANELTSVGKIYDEVVMLLK